MTFSLEVKVSFVHNIGLLNSCYPFVYVVEAIFKYIRPFSSMLLVRIHLFFFIKFPYIGCLIS